MDVLLGSSPRIPAFGKQTKDPACTLPLWNMPVHFPSLLLPPGVLPLPFSLLNSKDPIFASAIYFLSPYNPTSSPFLRLWLYKQTFFYKWHLGSEFFLSQNSRTEVAKPRSSLWCYFVMGESPRNSVLPANAIKNYRSVSLLVCKQGLLVICSHGRWE